MSQRHVSIGMLGWIQVKPGWADYPVQRQGRCRWRGCWGSRSIPLPEGHRAAGGGGKEVQE